MTQGEVEPFYAAFGQLVRGIREKAGLSQAQLAHRVGLQRASIANIEAGNQRLSLHRLLDFAEALWCDPVALLPAEPLLASSSDRLDEILSEEGASDDEMAWLQRVRAQREGQL